jgi:zinc protease
MLTPIALAASLLASPLHVEHLDNGLTLVMAPFDSPGVVAYFTLVRAGSRDEVEAGKSGYAHLFEHLMFRGTEKVTAQEYEARMQALGADNNASTWDDFTIYEPVVASEAIPELAALDADRFKHLSYSPVAYKDETGAVLGEYNKNAASPELPMIEALDALAFTRHTYGHTTLGWKRDVQAMPNAYEYSRAFWKRFYTPDDCTLFVVGDFDEGKVSAAVHAHYSDWTGKRAVSKVAAEPEQTAPRRRAITWKNPTSPRLLVGYRIPAAGKDLRDTAALAVVGALALGESSELYERLVVKEQKLINLEFDPDDVLHEDPGLFPLTARLAPGTSFDEIEGAVNDTFAKIGLGETPESKLDAVRRHVNNTLVLDLQTPRAVALTLARWTALTGDPGSFDAYAAALSRVTADDIARVAKTYLVPARRNVVTLVSATAPAAVPAKKVTP